ncbi:MAG: sodium-dependent transporter [Deltaproteobacteria bacterium]|nr:sodium-dependent transporter [Deltaproteobacteria bacterium]
MSRQTPEQRGSFGGLGFILAAAGSAIGLGNIWKFPYIAYENGGGSFVLVYLAAILIIGSPIMVAEVLIGRRTQQSPVGAFLVLAKDVAGGKAWSVIGWLGILAGFFILSYYAVVAGWTVYYFGKCVSWSINGFTAETAAGLGTEFGAFLGNGTQQVFFQALFMGFTMGVVILGVKGGIERTTKFLMPLLMSILVVLALASFRSPGFGEAIGFLFHLGPIDSAGLLEAVGHSFFTLSLGMGAMITYGSYVSRQDSIPRATATICLLDTLIAIMASLIMFTIIFGVPVAERATTFTSRSATILFTTLPRMFYELPGGVLLSPVFYLLVALAALTSTISLLEVVVAYFIDVRGWTRRFATMVVGGLIFLFGVPSALSLGASPALTGLWGRGFFGTVDYLASNWLLPVGGLGIAIFTGWVLSSSVSQDEIETGHGKFGLKPLWMFLLKFVCPLAIGWIIWTVLNGGDFS